MSASIAQGSHADTAATARPAAAAPPRDLRLDFVRGIALLLIFIDHVSGNRFAALTLQSMGFADAAEVFVLVAGMAGVYAYRRVFIERGFVAVNSAVLKRVRLLYLAHLGMAGGVIAFAALALAAGTGFDIVAKLGLQPLLDDPAQALLRLPFLGYLPHYMDILPLYVVLLSGLPLIFLAFKVHVLLPLGMALAISMVASAIQLNFPSFGDARGWFLNPFSWALLFVAGATVAELSRTGALARLPRGLVAGTTVTAIAYVAFAFLHAAPWRVFPSLEALVVFETRLVADKTYLSWHRLADIAAKAWIVAVLVPPTARFMAHGIGGAITRAGRNSLPLFIAGTILALVGSIVLFETGGHPLAHIAVTFGGVTALLVQAWILERRPNALANAKPAVAAAVMVRAR
jgi:hypothetical protein